MTREDWILYSRIRREVLGEVSDYLRTCPAVFGDVKREDALRVCQYYAARIADAAKRGEPL